jgi:hypothetical protein
MQPRTIVWLSRTLLWSMAAGVLFPAVPVLADNLPPKPGVYSAVAAEPPSAQQTEWIAEATAEDMESRGERAEDPPRSVPLSEMISNLMTTARRRQERVQSTPVAVSNFSSDQLLAREVRRLSDLDGLVPNLAVDPPTARQTHRGGPLRHEPPQPPLHQQRDRLLGQRGSRHAFLRTTAPIRRGVQAAVLEVEESSRHPIPRLPLGRASPHIGELLPHREPVVEHPSKPSCHWVFARAQGAEEADFANEDPRGRLSLLCGTRLRGDACQ